jgi:hypothetical protein
MRCLACNVELTDHEATYKDENGFVDMCSYCIAQAADTTPMEKEYVQESSRSGNNYDT